MDFILQENIQTLRQWMAGTRHPLILGHTHPDGDAIGSTAGLALYLQGLGKTPTVIFPDTPAANLRFMQPETVSYLYGDTDEAAAKACIAQADLIILADANAFNRVEGLAEALQASSAHKVLMDHHLNPDYDSFAVVFSTPDISSASEVVYQVLKALTRELTVEIGTALLAGMTTDTNNFANSVFPSTLQMASELLALGVDRDALLVQLYQSYRENRVRLMGYMQSEQLHILPNGTAYMILTRDIQQRFGLLDGESEGLVNVPLSIGPVKLSVLLKEDVGHFRVSVRSKKGTSAQQLALRHFHGGGHENAAGGKLFIGQDIACPEEASAYIEQVLKDFLA